eukprot:5014046-Amphidinium_carterae.1
MMLASEDAWLSRQIVRCKTEPEAMVPILPHISPDVMAQKVDLSTFPTFDDWKAAMWAAPFVASHQ